MEKTLMKGNEAIGEAAIRAGCRFFFGYPITPQNELPEYMSRRLLEVDGTFIQAESEVSAINMVYGAAGAGARVMTSSSSPGISLKQEGISYIAGAEVPCVIANIVRGGPGLGSIQPAQSDYFQSTKAGGHGDYFVITYAPASVQELVDLTMDAFEVADKYRNPAMIFGDGILGQMMEPVELSKDPVEQLPEKEWATTGMGDRTSSNIINSLALQAEKLEDHNLKLKEKYDQIQANETRYEILHEDAEYFVVAYGTTSRACKNAINQLREKGYNIGLIRPISIWPFPFEAFEKVAGNAKEYITVEMNLGQMVEDVKLAVNGAAPVKFYGRTGGVVPTPSEIAKEIERLLGGDQ
ncbi:3-methyl-2-oxobutanoate dehydrogenase subunit VorB [Natranaerobius thermophilus]|nr:3-methyl-2-oxobutanoate dehydrogenase subunit VorB [Natranaerobius thermophilus]